MIQLFLLPVLATVCMTTAAQHHVPSDRSSGNRNINVQLTWLSSPLSSGYLKPAISFICYESVNHITKDQWCFMVSGSYIADDIYRSGGDAGKLIPSSLLKATRININATVCRSVPGWLNSSVFLQAGFYGSDAYSAYYVQSVWQFRFGLAFVFKSSPSTNTFDSSSVFVTAVK